MRTIQWIIYDQFNTSFIEPGVTDVAFVLFTGERISSPVGNLTFNVRSRIAEYAMAKWFLDECRRLGYAVHWMEARSYREGLETLVRNTGAREILTMRSSEEYLARKIADFRIPGTTLKILPNRQFLIGEDEFRAAFDKPPIMETFYRYMRKSRGILMESDFRPAWGKWNYDHENREFDPSHVPDSEWSPKDVRYVEEAKSRFGVPELDFSFPTTRNDALSLLEHFLDRHFWEFGRLEDAMYLRDGKVRHSLLSAAINFWLLSPDEVIEAALAREAPLSSKEGFVRQILGWREYVRQFYLYYYDTLYSQNVLGNSRPLPESWWDYASEDPEREVVGMRCVDTVLARVKRGNYSHHIERLMVVGNFALLAGYRPLEVDRWFWEMYVDAFEWVVTPNVLAMSQYSDGGRLATKPYVSWGNYLSKMSDFCSECRYGVKEKTCPMTHLYWDFVDRNRDIFQKGRTPYVLSSLAKIDIENVRRLKAEFLCKRDPGSGMLGE